jgi:hypothetical protein
MNAEKRVGKLNTPRTTTILIRTFIAHVNFLCGGCCVVAVVMAEDFCHFAQGLL